MRNIYRYGFACALLFLSFFAHAEPFAYIPNSFTNSISVIDTATNTVTATVTLPCEPGPVYLNAAGTRVYASCSSGIFSVMSTIAVDTATNVATTLPAYECCVLNPAGDRLYRGDVTVMTVTDVATAVQTTIQIPGMFIPVTTPDIVFNPSGSKAYFLGQTSQGSFPNNVLWVFDTASNTATPTAPLAPGSNVMAINRSGTRIYATTIQVPPAKSPPPGVVSVIDTGSNAVIATVSLGFNSGGQLLLNNAGTRLYVLSVPSNQVLVIDTAANALIATIPLPTGSAVGMVANPSGSRVYVTNSSNIDGGQSGNGNLTVIDANSNAVIAIQPTGIAPGVPGIDPAGKSVYVTNFFSNTVTIVDTASNTVTANLPVGGFPNATPPVNYVYSSFIGPNVHIAPSATGSGTITAAFTDGGAGCSYANAQFIAAPPGMAPVPPIIPNSSVTFPHGLFDFQATGCAPGATLSFIVTYPAALDPSTQFWKYGPTPDNTSPHWYVLPAVISGNTASFSITDGGLGDDDLVANGTVAGDGGAASGGGTGCAFPPQSGWWWNNAQGGRGYFVDFQDGKIYFAAEMYDSSGHDIWYIASGAVAGNGGPGSSCAFSGTLYDFGGGQTLSGAYQTPTSTRAAGTVTIVFTDPYDAVATLPGETIPITRYVYSGPYGGQSAENIAYPDPRTGIWWNPAEGGRGFAIEIQNGVAYISGYMYDVLGLPAWYVSGPGSLVAGNAYSGLWQQYANGQYLGGPYRAPSLANADAGALTVQFADPSHATLTLPTGVQIPIQRYTQ